MKKERNVTKELKRNFKLAIDNKNGDNINTYNYTDTYTYKNLNTYIEIINTYEK